MIKLTFLGTGSMVPTPERNQVSVMLTYKDENIMIDCGEGTQRQLRTAGIAATKITKLLVTHWHGDHTLGIPGLIATLGANEYSKILEIFGPKHTKSYFINIFNTHIRQNRVKLNVKEIEDGIFYENNDFKLECISLVHPAPCMGYAFIEKDRLRINTDYLKKFGLKQHPIIKELQAGKDIEWKGRKIAAKDATYVVKGKKITFISDTNYTSNIIKLAKNSDLLVCEATHLDELKEKTEKYKHLTAKQAAEIAKKADVKKLIITHFSQRYKDATPLKEEAKALFQDTIAAEDFMTFDV